jgi:Photosynthetic reaction centre cytochrome C subunit/Tetratricopeptide repeat
MVESSFPGVPFNSMRLVRCLTIVVLLAGFATAQMPEKFTNLQVFPKDIQKETLMATMRNFTFSLGVRCDYCHAETADHKMNFASDDKDEKKTARVMLHMVQSINTDYIKKLGAQPVEVRCVTCHRGIPIPQPINEVLMATVQKKDVSAAIAQYKDLKTKYYGGAAYDFTETPLNQLAESLLDEQRGQDAAKIMEMNVAENPKLNHRNAGWTYSVMAKAHLEAGEKDKAKADLQHVLEANPNNKWAKEELEKLSKP